MNDELKEWKTNSYKLQVASILMRDHIPFSFDEENGIMFTAPEWYVQKMKHSLVCSFGCTKKPIITEF